MSEHFFSYSLLHWGQENVAAIFPMTFSNAFCWMKMFQFRTKYHWNLFMRVHLIENTPALVQIMGLHQKLLQAIIWISDGIVYGRIYASLDLDELSNTEDMHAKHRVVQNVLLKGVTRGTHFTLAFLRWVASTSMEQYGIHTDCLSSHDVFKPVTGTGFNISSDHIKLRKYVFRFNSHPNTPFCSLEDLTGTCIIF